MMTTTRARSDPVGTGQYDSDYYFSSQLLSMVVHYISILIDAHLESPSLINPPRNISVHLRGGGDSSSSSGSSTGGPVRRSRWGGMWSPSSSRRPRSTFTPYNSLTAGIEQCSLNNNNNNNAMSCPPDGGPINGRARPPPEGGAPAGPPAAHLSGFVPVS